KESNAASPKDEMKIIKKATIYNGLNIRDKPFLFSGIIAALCRSGSFNNKNEIIAEINAKAAATKNGTLVPNTAKNPPIPGPIINPVLIAADIYPIAFALVSTVVISAINAVTAGIINAALIPPKH